MLPITSVSAIVELDAKVDTFLPAPRNVTYEQLIVTVEAILYVPGGTLTTAPPALHAALTAAWIDAVSSVEPLPVAPKSLTLIDS
ncbi:hypothetical protein WJ13_18475 [Burkholderia seminalis]|nr:hypothetical protein WJ13_18475 [Burkholderia seminalis]